MFHVKWTCDRSGRRSPSAHFTDWWFPRPTLNHPLVEAHFQFLKMYLACLNLLQDEMKANPLNHPPCEGHLKGMRGAAWRWIKSSLFTPTTVQYALLKKNKKSAKCIVSPFRKSSPRLEQNQPLQLVSGLSVCSNNQFAQNVQNGRHGEFGGRTPGCTWLVK